MGGQTAAETFPPVSAWPLTFLEGTDLASDPGSSILKKRLPEGPDRPQKGAIQRCQTLLTPPPGTCGTEDGDGACPRSEGHVQGQKGPHSDAQS